MLPKWPKGSDCKSDCFAFGGSNPSHATETGSATRISVGLRLSAETVEVLSAERVGVETSLREMEAHSHLGPRRGSTRWCFGTLRLSCG